MERRRSVRVEENLEFQFGIDGYDIRATTLNISSHGAMCLVDTSLPLMAKLKISLSLSSKKILIDGVIVRKEKDPPTNRFYIAIFFSGLKPVDRKVLDEFICRRLSR